MCLVEYDLQAGDLRAFLDLPYRRSVVDLAPVADELTTRHLQEALYTHAIGHAGAARPPGGRAGRGGDRGRGPQHPHRDPHARGPDDRRRGRDAERGERDRRRDGGHGSDRDDARRGLAPRRRRDCARCGTGSRSSRPRSRYCSTAPRASSRCSRTWRGASCRCPVLQTNVPADFFALESAVNTGIPADRGASDAMLGPMAGVLGEISALPAGRRRGRADRARRASPPGSPARAARHGRADGQPGDADPAAPVAWQLVLVGMTFVFAGTPPVPAPRAGGRRGRRRGAPRADLPGPWHGANGRRSTAGQRERHRSSVKVPVPLLLPGLAQPAVRIQSSARTVIEEQTLAGEANGIHDASPGSARRPSAAAAAIVGAALLATLKYTNLDHAVIDPATGDGGADNAPRRGQANDRRRQRDPQHPYMLGRRARARPLSHAVFRCMTARARRRSCCTPPGQWP